MKRFNWQIFLLGLLLVIMSAFFYSVHYLLFEDSHHIFIYMVGDMVFVPVEVLLVTLIIHRLLSSREKHAMLEKLNMVIGAFFSEVGTELLDNFADFDSDFEESREKLIVGTDWSEQDFSSIIKAFKNYSFRINSQKGDLEALRSFLIEKRAFLLIDEPELLCLLPFSCEAFL